MRIDVLTLFPSMFEAVLGESIVKRAVEKGLVEITVHDLRDWSKDNHRSVDSRPYGGGPGMVLKVDVVHPAIKNLKVKNPEAKVVLLTPQGEGYSQKRALDFSNDAGLILIAGHYEGYDERIRDYVDMELSIGDYVLTGGELPAMVVIDSVVRLIPGVLGDEESVIDESFGNQGLDFPQYTRPEVYENKRVPEILLGGNHGEIEKWRKKQAEIRTKKRRPDLLE